MAVCNVLNTRAEKVGEVDLNDALFNIEVNPLKFQSKTRILLFKILCLSLRHYNRPTSL